MRFTIMLILLLTVIFTATGQQTLIIKTVTVERSPIAATIVIRNYPTGFVSDSLGAVSVPFPSNGAYVLAASAVGYEEKQQRISIPFMSDTLVIVLERSDE